MFVRLKSPTVFVFAERLLFMQLFWDTQAKPTVLKFARLSGEEDNRWLFLDEKDLFPFNIKSVLTSNSF